MSSLGSGGGHCSCTQSYAQSILLVVFSIFIQLLSFFYSFFPVVCHIFDGPSLRRWVNKRIENGNDRSFQWSFRGSFRVVSGQFRVSFTAIWMRFKNRHKKQEKTTNWRVTLLVSEQFQSDGVQQPVAFIEQLLIRLSVQFDQFSTKQIQLVNQLDWGLAVSLSVFRFPFFPQAETSSPSPSFYLFFFLSCSN